MILTTLTDMTMTDVTGRDKQGRARVDVRKNGKYRLRINCVHEDQLELILMALEKARKGSNTQYDAVALTNICVEFLVTS